MTQGTADVTQHNPGLEALRVGVVRLVVFAIVVITLLTVPLAGLVLAGLLFVAGTWFRSAAGPRKEMATFLFWLGAVGVVAGALLMTAGTPVLTGNHGGVITQTVRVHSK